MILRTDDDIWRARLVYLGPTGYTFPVQLPYAEYGLFAAVASTLSVIGYLLAGDWSMIGVAVGVSLFVTSWIWNHLDHDLSARKFIKVRLTDWRTTRPADESRIPAMSARKVRIGDLP